MPTRAHVLSVCALLSCLPLQARAADEAQTLVVLDLVSERGIDDGIIHLLNELLLTEFQRTGKYKVMGGTDIQALLTASMQKQLMGCEDVACLAQIGGALGADLLAVANIGRIGNYFLLNVKILNVTTAEVVARWSEQVEGIEDKLLSAVRKSVSAVAGGKQGGAQPAGGPDEGVDSTLEPAGGGGVDVLPIALWATGGLGLGLGLGFGIKTKEHYDNATDPLYVGSQVEDESGRQSQLIANVALAVGATAVAAGFLVWLLRGDSEAPVATVTPNRNGDGVFVTIASDF